MKDKWQRMREIKKTRTLNLTIKKRFARLYSNVDQE